MSAGIRHNVLFARPVYRKPKRAPISASIAREAINDYAMPYATAGRLPAADHGRNSGAEATKRP